LQAAGLAASLGVGRLARGRIERQQHERRHRARADRRQGVAGEPRQAAPDAIRLGRRQRQRQVWTLQRVAKPAGAGQHRLFARVRITQLGQKLAP